MIPIKQTVMFDPSNLEHRTDLNTFITNNSLGRMKNKYDLSPPYLSVRELMINETLMFYLNKEFHN